MSAEATELETSQPNHGWRVTFAGLGINLALGVLYSWSVISGEIEKAGWGWSNSAADRALPYSVACFVFCLIMVPAGRMQDKLSPKFVATIGGILVGVGGILLGAGIAIAKVAQPGSYRVIGGGIVGEGERLLNHRASL